ncbi:MAG: hypothetical protein II844_03040 [Prevotella sp.]|nr:hypothetical protein [Prevotella sp.]
MKKTLIFTLASMAMLFAGCSENADETKTQTLPKGNQVTLTVSAVTKTSPQTRVAYGSTDATWETGDKIFLVKSDGTTITLTLSSGAGTSTGSFTSTDPVVAGTYTPYAVSASSLSKGYVSIANGEITLDLSAGGGGTLANALEHDILKGDAVVLTDGQSSAAIENLTTHILSYIRFQFTATAKAVSSIGISSAEGINQTVTIAANGTVTGSNPTTSTISVSASNVGDNTYAGYIAVYASTPTGLVAHAEDADGGKYSRLVSTISANYTAGKVYGKTFTLSDAMMTAAATGTLSDQNWKNLGLSVKWSEFYVGTSTEYAWSTAYDAYCSVPAGWSGWRFPTTAEVQELYYASNKQWIENTGMRFNCNDNYVVMGASGRYRTRDDGRDWNYDQGTIAYFYVDELSGDLRKRAAITSSSLSFGTPSTSCNNMFCFDDYFAMRLVCDY